MTIGANIRRIRERHDMTQEEFGRIANVSSMAVSQWENDRAVPRMGAVQAIADYFKISKGEIIDDEPVPAAQPAGAIPVYSSGEATVPPSPLGASTRARSRTRRRRRSASRFQRPCARATRAPSRLWSREPAWTG